jgi:S-DNA-T family DNA segregation ATPase FtsK/SpoIIIE
VKLSNAEAAKSTLSEEDFNIRVETSDSYKFPPLDLLKKGKSSASRGGDTEQDLRNKAIKLEDTLHSFNIDAKVVNVTQGPAVTRYEVHPNSGVKVKGIKSLADDIALNMEAKSIRIEAPIPGKAAVGIEIENDRINMVTMREMIDSAAFRNAKSKISFAVGKDIAGNSIVSDLKAMPHLLIAGSTGSGKSVCINSIITSILYKARPDEVKLVLVDPKVVELANYNGIPHLLIPVVTEPAKAAAALNWAVAEMDERYKRFAEEGSRELDSYNKIMAGKGEEDKVMPQIVIIIDELADLMMAAPSQVEDSICRLAQKARAAGMHLIVATQRPSVDVITGVIKANIPSRIAFAVSSQVDSRTILDMSGAEKLVGKGDMLFNPLGSGKPIRVQGAFISDNEVHDVIEYVKAQTEEAEYSEQVIDSIERANTPDAEKGNRDLEDELLPDAIELVVQAQQASVSMLQRRFRIGYNRAARIIDMMEDRQIIGPSDGSRPRQVLITEEELEIMNESTEDLE